MDLRDLRKHWHAYGRKDPLFAIASWAGKQGNRWDLEEFLQTGTDEVAALMEYLRGLNLAPSSAQGKALDFGCGVGRLTLALAPHFAEVDGVDIAPSMIDLARKIALARQTDGSGGQCRYFANASNDLRLFPDNNFDFIYCNITLQHMEPAYSKNYVRDFVRVLKPGGTLVFQQTAERIAPLVPERKPPATSIGRGRGGAGRLARASLRRAVRWVESLRIRRPIMEMYGVPRAEVLALLAECGARVVDVTENKSGGPSWTSFRYCVVK